MEQQAFQSAPQQAQQSQQQPPTVLPPPQSFIEKVKANKIGIIVGSIAFVLVLGVGAYFVSPARKTIVAPAAVERPEVVLPTTAPATSFTPNKQPSPTPAPTIPAISWKTYSNASYGYSIKYPPDWTAKDLGALEPKVPSYIVFNSPSASASARNITVSISIRSYSEELALGASGSATTVGGIQGTKQSFQDSDGNTSTVITLPRTSNLLVLRAKTAYLTIFNQMLTTLQTTK